MRAAGSQAQVSVLLVVCDIVQLDGGSCSVRLLIAMIMVHLGRRRLSLADYTTVPVRALVVVVRSGSG